MAEKAELARWKQKRNGYRMNARRQADEAQQILQTDLDADLEQLERAITKLRLYSENLEDLGSKITPHLDDAAAEKELEAEEQLDNTLPELITDLEILAQRIKRRQAETTDRESAEMEAEKLDIEKERLRWQKKSFELAQQESEHRKDREKSKKSTLKLQQTPFQKFEGEILNYRSFKQSFMRAVDSDRDFSDTDKLNALKNHVTGPAFDLIGELNLEDANYAIALKMLDDKYGGKRAQIHAHTEQIFALPSIDGNDTKGLRAFQEKLEKHLLALEALGESSEQSSFITLIMQKLPTRLRMEFNLHGKKADEEWTVKGLRTYFAQYVKVCSEGDQVSNANSHQSSGNANKQRQNNPSKQNQNGHYTPRPMPTGASLLGSSNPDDNKRSAAPSKCPICERGKHWANECRNFKDGRSRLAQIRELKKCSICFRSDHQTKDCPKMNRTCYYCKKTGHNKALCYQKFTTVPENSGAAPENRSREKPNPPQQSENNGNGVSTSAAAIRKFQGSPKDLKVYPMSAVTEARGTDTGNILVELRLLLDNCSWRTFISRKMAKKLRLKPYLKEFLSIGRVGGGNSMNMECEIVDLILLLKDGSLFTIRATIIDEVVAPITRHPYDQAKIDILAANLHMSEPIVHAAESVEIDLLIGLEFFHQLTDVNVKLEVEKNLFLVPSKFGWMLTGSIESDESYRKNEPCMVAIAGDRKPASVEIANLQYQESDSNLEKAQIPRSFWELESAGILSSPYESDHDVALQKINDSIVKLEDGRYQAEYPKKEEMISSLPNNYPLALGQLKSSLNRMSAEDKFAYDTIIKDQIKAGIVELLVPELEEGPIKHYLCHHGVKKPDKPTHKLRIVYNASAKMKKSDPSLNECLYPCPNLLGLLIDMLLRFRITKIALVSDIEKAFLQIAIKPSDRDLTRFLWVKDITNPNLQGNLIELRFPRMIFGIGASPGILNVVTANHLIQSDSKIAKQIQSNIYVDNVIGHVETVEEGKNYYAEAKALFHDCKMNLREWFSNSAEITGFIPESDRGKDSVTSVLGIQWDTKTDTISVKGSNKLNANASTKRQVLHSAAKIYDPLGLFAPLTVKAKLYIQSLWKEKVDWDVELTKEKQNEWAAICAELSQIENIALSRFVGPNCPISQGNISYELVCFCDASPQAYSTVIYLRITTENSVTTNIIRSRNRLAPINKMKLKTMSLPRLELMAVVLGVQDLQIVVNALYNLQISKIFIFSDSECVLHWIQTNKTLTVFVSNCLKKIKTFIETCSMDVSIRYVASADNSADFATKTLSVVDTVTSEKWLHGPQFLSNQVEKWPAGNVSEITAETLEKINKELKRDSQYDLSLLAGEGPKGNLEISPFGINLERYSSLAKVLRVTAYALRFVRKLQKKSTENGALKAAEIMDAKVAWEKHVQKIHFAEIFKSIEKKSKNQLKDQLGLYIDQQGILRCTGRIINSELPVDTVFPKLLPREDRFTYLTIYTAHCQVGHSKTRHTLATLRQEYWIPKGRLTIQKVIRNCRICRRYEGGPFQSPEMPPLPKARVTPTRPFTFTGVDYLGPLFVKEIQKDGTKSSSKVWVALFTCLTVRAVHLEIIRDLSAEQFLNGLRRFIARRGKPETITSDNAPCFKLTAAAMEKLWESVVSDENVQNFVANRGIKWRFIPEFAPWMGGYYERLVSLVKRALRKSIGNLFSNKYALTFEQLRTLTVEIESILNSRPLVEVGSEFDPQLALTPAHFLGLHMKTGLPETNDAQNDENDPDYQEGRANSIEKLLETWKKGQAHLNRFWKTWESDYLLSLRERGQTWAKHPRVRVAFSPKVGDVVLIKDMNLSRGCWKIARVHELNVSPSDGEIRSVKLKLPNKNVLIRPVRSLYPLEFAPVDETPEKPGYSEENGNSDAEEEVNGTQNEEKKKSSTDSEKKKEDSSSEERIPESGRPRRQAAQTALRKIAKWTKNIL